MTLRHLLEQLNRFEKDTNLEIDSMVNWWNAGGTGSKYMTPHNEGHKIAIETIRNIAMSSSEYLDTDSIKKFIKKEMKKHRVYLKQVDDAYNPKEDNDDVFDDKYHRLEGINCAYQTILGIVRKEIYFEKTPRGHDWTWDMIARLKSRKEDEE